MGAEKAEQIRLRSKVHSHIETEMRNANNLLLQNENNDDNAFLTKFNTPYIKTQREDTANAIVSASLTISAFPA